MIRFLIAGFVVNATDFGVYYILFHFLPFGISKGISFVCAGVVGYVINKYWTFKRSAEASVAEVGRYVFVNFLALGINVLTNQAVLGAWPGAILPALIIASMVTGVFTFISFKWWVFRVLLKRKVYLAWWKWFPLRYLVKDVARRQGFIDPIKLLSQMENFAYPSEVVAPMELLRLGVVMHARGLINTLAIQNNLDWIWPYWVECQYNPRNEAFIPRSFSLTQINLTHRNWTALGVPDGVELPLVDPRGLITPYYDSWSIDAWIIPEEGEPLIPSRAASVSQKMVMGDDLYVVTESNRGPLQLQVKAHVIGPAHAQVCEVAITGASSVKARLVVSLRPYNPEGVSFINNVTLLESKKEAGAPAGPKGAHDPSGWLVNRDKRVYFDTPPDQYVFSDYQQGDVYSHLSQSPTGTFNAQLLPPNGRDPEQVPTAKAVTPVEVAKKNEEEIFCKVGMASAAALYALKPGQAQGITISVPLTKDAIEKEPVASPEETAHLAWKKSLQGACSVRIPDGQFQFLYEAAIHTMVLHSPKEVFPGPFVYRRFWFRDAAFILHGLLSVGLKERARRALDCFRFRQTAQGYFLSQEGEWDSNGEALWIMRQYCEMTGHLPPEEWKKSIYKAGMWICNKRLPNTEKSPHSGLLPSGFSAEHLGPNDFYYWDDFWAVAGLKAAAFLCAAYGDTDKACYFEKESGALVESIDKSLLHAQKRLKRRGMPASPYRRLDSGAIGSLAAGYPLSIFGGSDPRILDTAHFLMSKCLVHGGFFHDMTHSGINPYLTLHLAQVLLRAQDVRYFGLMTAVAKLASPTGQWPESVHPRTGGGCMGDGQHVWAAAEWVLMIRNCFVREEEDRLILCSGIPRIWLETGQTMTLGPAPTRYGDMHIAIKPSGRKVLVEWRGEWLTKEPPIDIQLPGFTGARAAPGTNSIELKI